MSNVPQQTSFFKKHSQKIKLFLMRQFSKFIPPEKVVFVFGPSIGPITSRCIEVILSEKMNAVAATIEGDDASWQSNLAATMIKINNKTEKAIFSIPDNAYMYDPMMFSFIQPKTVVVTGTPVTDGKSNIKNQYLQFVEDVIDKMGGKGDIFLNWHDSALRKLGEEVDGSSMFFGFNSEFCHIWAGNMRIVQSQTMYELNYGVERVEIASRLLGKQQVAAMLAAAAVGVQNGIALTSIKKAFEKMDTIDHKLQLLEGYNGSTVLDDTFDDGFDSWSDALETLNKLPARRRIVVLAGMKGIEGDSEKIHRELGQMLYKEHIDIVLCGGGEALFVSDEMKKLGFYEGRLEENMSNQNISSKLLKIAGKGDLILIKGNESERFDEIIKKLAVKK